MGRAPSAAARALQKLCLGEPLASWLSALQRANTASECTIQPVSALFTVKRLAAMVGPQLSPLKTPSEQALTVLQRSKPALNPRSPAAGVKPLLLG